MATTQLTASSISAKGFASFEGLRSTSNVKVASFALLKRNSRLSRGLVWIFNAKLCHCNTFKGCRAVLEVFLFIFFLILLLSFVQYTSVKPLGDRVLVKIKTAEEKSVGGILLPTSAQSKPQGGEIVAVGEGRSIGKTKVEISVKNGTQVLYSKYAGTEVLFDGSTHLILKEDDIVGILETDDIKDLQPLNDRILIKVAEVEEKTAGGLFLSEAAKEKPSIGSVIAAGPGPLDEEGNRKSLSVSPGNTVLYSKYAGNDFKGADGADYVTLRASDVIAVLS
ncbi:20 kDa chaperonin, chloroplastic [Nicotiana tabacum]|uniref:20 kDa chaperonin, chloroplastic n=1 Tax=Nicotiana tabacum TaxID=4097 RepID=A0AC58TLF5_TOBAC